MADSYLAALRRSVERLDAIVQSIPDGRLTDSAYPTEWTIADVLSHLGSGAVIATRRLADILAGTETPDDFAQGVSDAWNAKAPGAQRADAIEADRALLDALESTTPEQRNQFAFSMGPIDVDFDGFVGLRLNEHAVHTWDIDVALDPGATIPGDVAQHVVGNLDLIARFTAKPTGDTRTVRVTTTDGANGLTVELAGDSVTATVGSVRGRADVELEADALVRLVYGRLDPGRSPAPDGPELDALRAVFPGP
jgi:uncharacterized protein (TIGR03083 family)